jgi:hypothetical protein
MANDDVDFGTDIDSSWTANAQGDFQTVSGTDNALQAIRNRLLTKLDELIDFGYVSYGNRAIEIIGTTDLKTAEQLIKLYTTECLMQEPRVEEIPAINVVVSNSEFTCEVDIKLIGEANTNNIVFSKSIQGG